MKPRKLVEEILISPGLKIIFYDASRPIAGDRWQVVLEWEIILELGQIESSESKEIAAARELVRKIHGEKYIKTQRKERNFISDGEKDDILANFLNDFKDNNLPYIRNPLFPLRLLQAEANNISKNKWKYGLA